MLARSLIPLTSAQPITPALVLEGYTGDWWNLSDGTSLFQDNGAATPVTAADQSVGTVVGQVNGWRMEQATAGLRPLIRSTGFLEPNGVDQFMARTISQNAFPMTMIAIAKGGSANGMFTVSAGVAEYKNITAASSQAYAYDRGPTTNSGAGYPALSASGGWIVGEWTGTEFSCETADAKAEVAVNTTQATETNLYFFKLRLGGSGYSGASIAQAFIVNRLMTQREKLGIANYLMARTVGLTL